MLATDYAEYYKLDPQGEDEADKEFRLRIAEALRSQGKIVESQEAYHDKRYEDNDDMMTAILGAVAQDSGYQDYGSKGDSRFGDDIALGTVIENPKPELTPEEILILMMLSDTD